MAKKVSGWPLIAPVEIEGGSGLPTPTADMVGSGLTVQMVDDEPTWAVDPYPGLDLVIVFDEEDYSCTLLKGTYSEIRAKLLEHSPVLHQLVIDSQTSGDICLKQPTSFYLRVRENDLYLTFNFDNQDSSDERAWYIWNSDDTFVYDD